MKKIISIDFFNDKIKGQLMRDGEWFRVSLVQSQYSLYQEFEIDLDGAEFLQETAERILESLYRLELLLKTPQRADLIYQEYRDTYCNALMDLLSPVEARKVSALLAGSKLAKQQLDKVNHAIKLSVGRYRSEQQMMLSQFFVDGLHQFDASLLDQFVWHYEHKVE